MSKVTKSGKFLCERRDFPGLTGVILTTNKKSQLHTFTHISYEIYVVDYLYLTTMECLLLLISIRLLTHYYLS